MCLRCSGFIKMGILGKYLNWNEYTPSNAPSHGSWLRKPSLRSQQDTEAARDELCTSAGFKLVKVVKIWMKRATVWCLLQSLAVKRQAMNWWRNLSQGRYKKPPGLSLFQALRNRGDKGWFFSFVFYFWPDSWIDWFNSIKEGKSCFSLRWRVCSLETCGTEPPYDADFTVSRTFSDC